MIDWISVQVPLSHTPIEGGRVMKLTADGELEWESRCWSDVPGSHDANLRVRSWGPSRLDISGNPTKFLQGHNLFGVDNLQGLVRDVIIRVAGKLGFPDMPRERARVIAMCSKLTRVDITKSYELPTRAAVRSWIQSAEASAHLRYRGRGTLTKDATLYFGKHSRRWSLKLYCKGDELEAHSLPSEIPFRESLIRWADNKLRVEVTMRGMELRDREIAEVQHWQDNTPQDLFNELVGGLQLSSQLRVPPEVLETLPPRLRLAYQSWRDGHDMRVSLPRRTFYRYRSELLPHGVDIAVKQDRDPSRDVVQLRRILEAVPAKIPAWAPGTHALYEPCAA